MKPVSKTVPLPYPNSSSISQLNQFDADMRRALVDYLFTIAFRLNGMLPADGSEAASMVHIEPPTGGSLADITATSWSTDPFHVGTQTGANIGMDGNEIMGRNNGVADVLNLNADGGEVVVGANAVSVNTGLRLSSGAIKFPATQQASSDANTLDDYEEGTFLPSLSFNGGTTGITYSLRTGNYVKIGQLVFAQGRIILSSKGSSTGQAILSVPFGNSSVGNSYTPISVGYFQSMSGLGGALSGYVEFNSVDVKLVTHGATGITAVVETNFTNTSDIIYSAVYKANV